MAVSSGYQSNYNTAVGNEAGYSLTTGNGNTFIGQAAGYNVTTGSKNTFIGGGDSATNYPAGYYVTTGSSNTILGNYNGNQGGLDIRTASNYIVLSDGDGNPRQIIDNNGNLGLGVMPSAWYIGSSWHAIQQVGGGAWSSYLFGGTNPNNILSVNLYWNTSGQSVYLTSNPASYYAQSNGAHNWQISSGTPTAGSVATMTQAMALDNSGRLGLGTTSPNAQLVVQGVGASGWVNGARNTLQLRNSNASGNQSCFISFGSAANDTYCWIGNDLAANGTQVNQLNVQAGSSGGVYLASGGTSWSSSSDARLKNITGTYTDALTDIAKLQPVKFTWKADVNNTPQVGVIAQSVQPVVPEAVTQGQMSSEDKTEYLSVRYTELIPLMIASIQQLKAELDTLKAKVGA